MLSAVRGQKKTKFLSNESIRFEILKESLQLIDTNMISPAKYFIKVDLSAKQRKILMSLSKQDWLKLLQDSKSDWAANLALYDVYLRDAILFNTVLKDKEVWKLSAKEKDVSYWNLYLKRINH